MNRTSNSKYKKWKEKVIAKHGYVCWHCGTFSKKDDIQVHHIFKWHLYPKLRYDVRNGIVLCRDCHALYDENERIYWMVKYRKLKEKYNKLKNMSLKENNIFNERLIEELEEAMKKGDRQKELEIRKKIESYLGPTAEEMEDYSDYI